MNQAQETIPNGPAAAAILAAGIGSAALGILSLAGDVSAKVAKLLNIYNPTGTLSGVTAATLVIWLISWYALHRRWRTRSVGLGKINVAAFLGLAIGLLLTFPPAMDFLQGK
ncbi:MAG: hypothetical protein ACLPIX_18255 [Rhodomicrobium sp.]